MKQQKYQKMKRSKFVQSWKNTFKRKSLMTMLLDVFLLVFLILSIFITSIIMNDAAKDFEEIYPSLLQMGQMTAQQTPEKLKELPLDDMQKTMGAIKVKLVISFFVFVLLICLGVSFSKGLIWSERFGLSGNKFNMSYFRHFLVLNLFWIGLLAVLSLLTLFLVNLPYNILLMMIYLILFVYFTPALYARFSIENTIRKSLLKNFNDLFYGLKLRTLLAFLIKSCVFLVVLALAALAVYLKLPGLIIIFVLFLIYFNWSRNFQKLVFEQNEMKKAIRRQGLRKNRKGKKKR